MIEKREWGGQNKGHCTFKKEIKKGNWKYCLKNAESLAYNGLSVGILTHGQNFPAI